MSSDVNIESASVATSVNEPPPEHPDNREERRSSTAYEWADVTLAAVAQDVEARGPRPTIISRDIAIVMTSMYDAWAAYDHKAVGTQFGNAFRRPQAERTTANKKTAVSYAAYRALLNLYPDQKDQLAEQMRRRGLDPDNASTELSTPEGVGNVAAAAVIGFRRHDGANQYGDEEGSNGQPYSDYTNYQPINPPDEIKDPNRWQPIRVPTGSSTTVQEFATPHWGLVEPFGLTTGDQFRPPRLPKVGSEQLRKEVEQVVRENAELTIQEKAQVEFFRDGPLSVTQAGQWLGVAQEVSKRDRNDLDRDVKLFFAIANVGMDAFVSAWEAKRFYDSSRPYTLVRFYFAGQDLRGWGGPGRGTVTLPAEEWKPYSPLEFPTPAFPGYPSGHSTVSGASSRLLELFTGSDIYGATESFTAGSLTEPGFSCSQIQRVEGKPSPPPDLCCKVELKFPTFSFFAEAAGFSRILGGYHIQTDNVMGLEQGRQVAEHDWEAIQNYFKGRPPKNRC